MRLWLLLLVLLLALFTIDKQQQHASFVTAAEQEEEESDDGDDGTSSSSSSSSFRIAGYLPDYRINESLNLTATLPLLDDIYLFSLSPQVQLGDNMFQACCLQSNHYELLKRSMMTMTTTTTKYEKPKVWVTVGGAGRSHKLTKAPSSMMRALARLMFEDQPVGFITGIDFDNELFLEHADYESYEKLVVAATNIFPPQGVAVSMALHVGQHTAFPMAVQKVDRINLMTYGMMSATYHADYTKMREAVENLIDEADVPASKIFLGLPAYGTHKTTGETRSYDELTVELRDDPAKRHKIYDIGGFLVDSPAAIQAKVRFAQQRGLGGVFFWEIGQDKDRVLLQAAAEQAGKDISSPPPRRRGSSTTVEHEAEPATSEQEEMTKNNPAADRDEL